MEEAPENSKELSHSAHANGMNEWGQFHNEEIRNMHCPTVLIIIFKMFKSGG
jgi:hypothetical protein